MCSNAFFLKHALLCSACPIDWLLLRAALYKLRNTIQFTIIRRQHVVGLITLLCKHLSRCLTTDGLCCARWVQSLWSAINDGLTTPLAIQPTNAIMQTNVDFARVFIQRLISKRFRHDSVKALYKSWSYVIRCTVNTWCIYMLPLISAMSPQ